MRVPPQLVPALITPFDTGGELDLDAHRHNVRFLAQQGATGFLVGGSTGEGPIWSPEIVITSRQRCARKSPTRSCCAGYTWSRCVRPPRESPRFMLPEPTLLSSSRPRPSSAEPTRPSRASTSTSPRQRHSPYASTPFRPSPDTSCLWTTSAGSRRIRRSPV